MKIKLFILLLSMIIITCNLFSQDHQHDAQKKDTTDNMSHEEMGMLMKSAKNLNRQGSGTGWLPDNSPMHGYMLDSHKWNFMFHGNLFMRYNNQDLFDKGDRGDEKFDLPNWFMGMARREVGHSGLIRLTAMFSLDPVTVGGEGYPLLFQSGETWEGKALVDRQHPHDLFSEISVEYTHSVNKEIAIIGYFGFPGEPAIGPVAFMHRPSALNNPDAPLGHHWQDATHITFGVATLGFQFHNHKVEGSLFTGREPNENRYNFDKPKFDSYSIRFLSLPTKEISFQVSHALVISPESIDPDENVRKTTASVIHNKIFNDKNILSSSLIWGLNDVLGEHQEHSILLESNFNFSMHNIYGRFEWIEKSSDELEIEELPHGTVYPIYALTLGINHSLLMISNTILSLGVQGSVFKPDKALVPYYGDTPVSVEVYLKISPGMMMH